MAAEIYEKISSQVEETFEELKKLPWVLGIDEAGRGPAIGPMVYSALYWPKKYEDLIVKQCSLDDSKKLTAVKREGQYEILQKLKGRVLEFQTTHLSAEKLSVDQLRVDKINLNAISHNTALNLIIDANKKGFNITECFLDTVGPKESYTSFLYKELKDQQIQCKITVTPKADSLFKVVSAASICAKVERDLEIERLQKEFKVEFGSGYPSDPYTKDYLDKSFVPVFGYEKFVRFSWQTIETLMEKNGVSYQDEEQQLSQSKSQNYVRIQESYYSF